MKQPRRYNYLRIEWSINEQDLRNDPDPAKYELRKQRKVARVWKWYQLHQTVTWPTKVAAIFDNRVRNKISDRLVILLEEDRWSRKKGNQGALMSIVKEQRQCISANHIMTMTAVEQEPKQPTLLASGQWVPARMWCIA